MECIKWIAAGVVSLVLFGCSGEEGGSTDPEMPGPEHNEERAGDSWADDNDDVEGRQIDVADQERQMLDNGYQKGRLTVELSIRQSATLDESSPAEGNRGPHSASRSIEHVMTATAQRPVWLVPQFNEMVPSLNDPERPADAWREPPYFERGEQPMTFDGHATFQLSSRTDAPTSSDVVHSRRSIQASAELEQYSIKQFEPSLFGQGYEFESEWEWLWDITENSFVFERRDGQTMKADEPRIARQSLELRLLPTINQDGLNPYPLTSDNNPDIERIARDAKKLEYDMIRNLSDPQVLTTTRSGLVTELSDTRVALSYQYAGPKQMVFSPPDLDVHAPQHAYEFTQNSMDVTVTLTVEE